MRISSFMFYDEPFLHFKICLYYSIFLRWLAKITQASSDQYYWRTIVALLLWCFTNRCTKPYLRLIVFMNFKPNISLILTRPFGICMLVWLLQDPCSVIAVYSHYLSCAPIMHSLPHDISNMAPTVGRQYTGGYKCYLSDHSFGSGLILMVNPTERTENVYHLYVAMTSFWNGSSALMLYYILS